MISQEDSAYLDYQVRWRTGDRRPGKHSARHGGAGGNFRGYRSFWQLPDARHIDVRRSVVDPTGDIIVRQMEQRSSIVVVLAADVSRSMAYPSRGANLQSVARLAEAAARSATRAGDAFAFFAFDGKFREDLSSPPSRRRAAAWEPGLALRAFSPDGRSAAGILDLAAQLPVRRCLLLLASDFLMPLNMLEDALSSLARHDVAPIVLEGGSDPALPRFGLLRMRDAETGHTRTVLMRPSLHRKFQRSASGRREALHGMFERHGRAPFYATGAIDIAELSQHLLVA
jgi:uncharacterized protein (DUF58 family)